MKKYKSILLCCILCCIFVLSIAACKKEKAPFTPQLVDIWYDMSLSDSYEMFEANFPNVISEEEYKKLQKLYTASGEHSSALCIVHTIEDGTVVLLKLGTQDFENYFIQSIEVIGQ